MNNKCMLFATVNTSSVKQLAQQKTAEVNICSEEKDRQTGGGCHRLALRHACTDFAGSASVLYSKAPF